MPTSTKIKKHRLRSGKDSVFFNVSSLDRPRLPLIEIANEENKAVKNFIEAVQAHNPINANNYISRHLKAIGGIDIIELKNVFNENSYYKYVENKSTRKSIIQKNTIIVIDKEKLKKDTLIHIYMVKEKNRISNWKICAIEKEV